MSGDAFVWRLRKTKVGVARFSSTAGVRVVSVRSLTPRRRSIVRPHPLMNSPADDQPSTAEREIISTRVFDAPRELLFRAWTEPEVLALWWGPKGFRNTFQVFEPKPGGEWRFVMHGPEGTDYRNESVFREIEEPSRIVLDHLSSPRFRVVATFDAVAEKTRLTFRMVFETAEMRDRVKGVVVGANEENFDRLEVQLERLR